MMLRLVSALLLAAGLATGCVILPVPTDLPEKAQSASLTKLRVGTTTRSDMVRLLGEPTAEFGERQAFWSYRHEKGQFYWLLIFLEFGSLEGPFDWGRNEEVWVLATFAMDGRLERLEWMSSDGGLGRPAKGDATTARRPAPEPEALPWARFGIESISPDGQTALVRQPLGAGFRLIGRDASDVVDLSVEPCAPAYSSAIFLHAGLVLIAGADRSPCIVDLTAAPPVVTTFPGSPILSRQAVTPASLDRDGSLLTTALRSERIDLMRTADGRLVRSLPMPLAQLAALAPDGSSVVAVSGGTTPNAQSVRIIDVATGTSSRELKRDFHVSAVAYNGQEVALAFNGHVEVWRSPGPDGIWTMEQVMLAPRYWSMAFVGDGRRLVAVATASVAAWDVDGWRQVLDLPIPSGRGAAFAADGTAAVSGAGFVDLPPLPQ